MVVSLHGFSNVLNFVMQVKDALHRKPWSVISCINRDFFDVESLNGIENLTWSIPQEIDSPIIEKAEVSPEPESLTDEGILHEDGNTKLAFLIRIR